MRQLLLRLSIATLTFIIGLVSVWVVDLTGFAGHKFQDETLSAKSNKYEDELEQLRELTAEELRERVVQLSRELERLKKEKQIDGSPGRLHYIYPVYPPEYGGEISDHNTRE